MFKSFFATAEDYVKWLDSQGVRMGTRPAPYGLGDRPARAITGGAGLQSGPQGGLSDPGAHLYKEVGFSEDGKPLKASPWRRRSSKRSPIAAAAPERRSEVKAVFAPGNQFFTAIEQAPGVLSAFDVSIEFLHD